MASNEAREAREVPLPSACSDQGVPSLPFLEPAALRLPANIDSRISQWRLNSLRETRIMGPQTHRLPFRVMWGINLLTAICVVFLNFAMLLTIEKLTHLKFWLMETGIHRGGVGLGVVTLTAVSAIYSLMGVCLIQFCAPNCGGSGIPENKTYLNGGSMPGFYTKRTLAVRVLTNILANSAGFPVGREGPMVTIGSNVAFKLSKFLAKPYVNEWVDFSGRGGNCTRMIDEQRLAHAARIACTVGGACAMTVIFNAPFGGLLYMFEEVTSVSWPLELTFRVFVCTMCSSLLSFFLCSLVGSDITEFVIYAKVPRHETWKLSDLPIFLLVAALIGILTSLHTRGMLAMVRLRQWTKSKLVRWQPYAVIAETTMYGALCASTAALVSLLGMCTEEGKSGLQYVAFNCQEGQYNPIASLLIATSHSSVKLLFSGGNAGEIHFVSSFLAFLTYSTQNVCLAGLPVPGGAFTATMLMGALFGRSIGALVHLLGFPTTISGVYAVVGSAAMLCGFKQMTLASVLIVVECVNDLSLAPVVMLAVAVSMSINWSMNKRGYDEEIIISRKLPFLEGEAPHELDSIVAIDLCDPLPSEAILQPDAPVTVVKRALEESSVCYFPVCTTTGGPCIGIVTRPHLESIIQAAQARSGTSSPDAATSDDYFLDTGMSPRLMARLNNLVQPSSPLGVPLNEVMDPTPFTIVEDTPAPRLYAMFAKAGERAACVTSRSGEFRGIISREGLIAASRPAH